MSEFDPIRALREEIGGLAEVQKIIGVRAVQAEQRAGEAEAELNAVRKLKGFADAELARKRAVLAGLEKEADGRA